ncbi:hypothetical protein OH77DRAFT_809981 [Trametes cingulata]|nr:hypothetical protein OH77DRAFT_809981 [Trametes cingulata]
MSSNLEVPVEEDVLSDVVPSNIVSRQESEGVESEYDGAGAEEEEMEVDELHSEGEKDGADGPPSPAKLAKQQASEERQKKKQKRKAEEGQLQVKRQEMDKAKVSPAAPIASNLDPSCSRWRPRGTDSTCGETPSKQGSSSWSSLLLIQECISGVKLRPRGRCSCDDHSITKY